MLNGKQTYAWVFAQSVRALRLRIFNTFGQECSYRGKLGTQQTSQKQEPSAPYTATDSSQVSWLWIRSTAVPKKAHQWSCFCTPGTWRVKSALPVTVHTKQLIIDTNEGSYVLVEIAWARGQRVVTASQRYTAIREQQEEEDDNIIV